MSEDTEQKERAQEEEKQETVGDKKNSLLGEPLPDDAPKNWSATVAIMILVIGVVIGFIVPVIGFVFYIIAGAIALIFSLISIGTFKKYGLPSATVGALICSLFLLGWGIFHMFAFASTAVIVLSLMQDGFSALGF